MSIRQAFFLSFSQGLHIGDVVGVERESCHDYLPSDTLFAAMATAWHNMESDAASHVTNFETGKVKFSSAFPFAGGVRFFPFPFGLRLNLPKNSRLTGKWRENVRWVSENVFIKILAGLALDDACDADKHLTQNGSFWFSEKDIAKFPAGKTPNAISAIDIRTRATVDRATSASSIFHAGHLQFAPQCGLWFEADTQYKEALLQPVHNALHWLTQFGLGGMRTYGMGAFTFTFAPSYKIENQSKPAPTHSVLLSRYAPASSAEIEKALQIDGTAYALQTIGGWCQDDSGHAWQRKRVRMVVEGSCVGSAAKGHFVDVAPKIMQELDPNRHVWRNGIAYARPVAEKALLNITETNMPQEVAK